VLLFYPFVIFINERKNKMKKTKFNVIVAVVLVLALTCCFFSCVAEPEIPEANKSEDGEILAEGLWTNATYRKDTTIGNGAKEVKIDVVVNKDTVVLTLKTDKATLGEALFSEGLVNDASFFDTLNGIKADWNADKAYWGFYKGEEFMMHGINDEKITGGEHYRFVYTK
jgi:hypothetical protein